ncbi:hypothetical protein ACQY1Q_14595 [Tenacibaculum sp. TC6]|uniref:hypothetical protein n=1 Tax=Tenacibaculum sp. TC6 TaxID=3423223 RepID=UPI003D35F817
MEENKNPDELDVFAKKYIREIEEEKPSVDFTATIMQTITQVEKTTVYDSTPLISKKVWFVLAGILGVCMFLVSKEKPVEWLKMPEFNFDFASRFDITPFLEGIKISDTVLYVCFFSTLMVFIQIYMLKEYFNKKLGL